MQYKRDRFYFIVISKNSRKIEVLSGNLTQTLMLEDFSKMSSPSFLRFIEIVEWFVSINKKLMGLIYPTADERQAGMSDE